MSARLSNAPRALFALLGALLPIVPSLVSGCGGSSAPPPTETAAGDAAAHFVNVITSGGGDGKSVPAAGPGASGSSSESGSSGSSGSGTASGSSGSSDSGGRSGSSGSSLSGIPFGSSGSSASGSRGSSGASASGSSSGSGGTRDSGTEGGSATSDAAPGICDDYTVTYCGSSPCDLRANTCCVTISLGTRCLPGTHAACATNEATLHCSNGCECPGGQACCGVENTIAGVVQTVCQDVPMGGHCRPYPSTTTMSSAQFCKADSQCKSDTCITQTCSYAGYSASFDICGLQSQAPFNCHL